jgi:DNA-binding transcriptional LysR family regulator
VELRQLEYFVAVAEEGHFNIAAARCHIARSGLSSSIRALERELGSSLFVRTTRQVQLTATGRALLIEARRTLAAAAEARDAVSSAGRHLHGRLSLGLTQANRAVDAPALLARYQATYPSVAISLLRGTATDIFDGVAAGTLDVGLSYLPPHAPGALCVKPLASGSMVFACSHAHPLAGQEHVALADLQDETFITVPPPWASQFAVDDALRASGVTRVARVEVAGLDTFLDLVRVGLGIAILPGPDAGGASSEMVRRHECSPDLDVNQSPPVCYVPLAGGVPIWTYGIVQPVPELRTAVARAFVDLLESAGRNGAGSGSAEARTAPLERTGAPRGAFGSGLTDVRCREQSGRNAAPPKRARRAGVERV